MRNLFKRKKSESTSPITAEEVSLIDRFINKGDVVFDIGAHEGDWLLEVDKAVPTDIFAFEASSHIYSKLKSRIEGLKTAGTVRMFNKAVASREKTIAFYEYPDRPMLSSAHRRISVEGKATGSPPVQRAVPSTSIDAFCSDNGIHRINYLKIDAEGAEYEILRGCIGMLRRDAIDHIQLALFQIRRSDSCLSLR